MSETKVCSNCGSKNPASNNFCEQCGSKLTVPDPQDKIKKPPRLLNPPLLRLKINLLTHLLLQQLKAQFLFHGWKSHTRSLYLSLFLPVSTTWGRSLITMTKACIRFILGNCSTTGITNTTP